MKNIKKIEEYHPDRFNYSDLIYYKEKIFFARWINRTRYGIRLNIYEK